MLLAYPAALAPGSLGKLCATFGIERVIEIPEEDAQRYAAKSFTYTRGTESCLIMPAGVADELQGLVREHGVTPLLVDESEFLEKGAGSVKCRIGDLGPVVE